jgi:hypothetical protein
VIFREDPEAVLECLGYDAFDMADTYNLAEQNFANVTDRYAGQANGAFRYANTIEGTAPLETAKSPNFAMPAISRVSPEALATLTL